MTIFFTENQNISILALVRLQTPSSDHVRLHWNYRRSPFIQCKNLGSRTNSSQENKRKFQSKIMCLDILLGAPLIFWKVWKTCQHCQEKKFQFSKETYSFLGPPFWTLYCIGVCCDKKSLKVIWTWHWVSF